ncbi:hypothetical protein CY34DRAFT_18761 [Suillus luteus UH-Slu-Lm8-n1]|uniref:Uncharacterized protein n=1 Tax=Suillus luteus UH-Slu-Lm8-n1 TaxID=930992 RepID=A0A0D0AF68_9AGAM|nr:hypothetical protein CY34DRAFT_18761 [Suillus luteus UH-Slu-Lm8-n1]
MSLYTGNPAPAAAPPLTHQLFIPPYTAPPANMTTVFKMPLRGTDAAPKFDGTPARLIPYLEDIEQLQLEIRLIDHHPEDPYDLKEVYNAAVFLLPSTSTASQPTAAAPARIAAPPPVAVHCPVTVKQQPSQDIVIKKEYNLPAGCFFCGGDHYPRECRTREEYVRSGKVRWGDNRKLIMANGRQTPYGREDGTFQERINKYLRDRPASGANTTALGSLFCCVAPTSDVVLDINPSAFLHTCANHQEDTNEDEEIKRLECKMVKVKEALTVVKVDRTNQKAEKGKDKSVRFDGVDIPRPRPGPSSKTVIPVEEVVSPQVKAAVAPPVNQPNLKALVVQRSGTATTSKPDSPANQSSTQYRYMFPLEDKEADK